VVGLPLLAVDVFLGWGWGVLTAGVVGASIGGGLFELVGGPLMVVVGCGRWPLPDGCHIAIFIVLIRNARGGSGTARRHGLPIEDFSAVVVSLHW